MSFSAKDQGSLGRAESNNLTAMLTKLGWVRKEKKERVKPYGPQFVLFPAMFLTDFSGTERIKNSSQHQAVFPEKALGTPSGTHRMCRRKAAFYRLCSCVPKKHINWKFIKKTVQNL